MSYNQDEAQVQEEQTVQEESDQEASEQEEESDQEATVQEEESDQEESDQEESDQEESDQEEAQSVEEESEQEDIIDKSFRISNHYKKPPKPVVKPPKPVVKPPIPVVKPPIPVVEPTPIVKPPIPVITVEPPKPVVKIEPTKKALLVGINYRGTSSELRGCLNDVENMKQYLVKNGYTCTVLTDDTILKPTRANIIDAFTFLLKSGADKLFFHYSGHGSTVRDYNGDESDGIDETLVPIDFTTEGMITDDILRSLLVNISTNSTLMSILDCCHSGTGMDLKYQLQENILVSNIKYSDTKSQVIMFSGCQDAQTSADAYEEKSYQGAMTFCVLKALQSTEKYTIESFTVKLRALLKQHGYTQIPNMTCGKFLDLKSELEFC